MGFENQLFSYFREGANEGMAITILGSRKSLQTQNKITTPYKNDTSMQTEVQHSQVDRDGATRDWERERVRGRYCRDLDVRYFSSLWNFKDRILSGYSCNQFQCPMIRERMESHQLEVHGKRPCETGCSYSGSKVKNCVSIKAGPDFDQFFGSKCTDCPLPESKSSCISTKPNARRNYHENCGKSDSKPENVRRNLRLDLKAKGTSTPINSCCMTNNESTESKVKSKYNETGTSSNKYPDYSYISSNTAKDFCGRYERIGPSNIANAYDNSNCGNLGGAKDRYNDSSCYETPVRPNNDGCSDSYAQSSRYVDCYTEPHNGVIVDTRNTRSCCIDTDIQYDPCMNNSYTGAIEPPKFALVSTDGETLKNQCKLDTEVQANCNEVPFIIKFDKCTDNSCAESVDTSQKPENETGCSKLQDQETSCSKPQGTASNLPNTNVKSKITKGFKNPYIKRPVESSTSYKLVPPYGVEGSSNDASQISVRTRPRRSSSITNPIYREVKEWIREVPLYPGLGKEAKQSNKQIINDLISNLYELSREAGSRDYDDKVRNKIDECLNKIPLWYPGAKRDQKGYKRSLVDQLHSRIKSLHRRNSSISQARGRRQSMSEVRASMISCHHSFNNVNPKDVEIRICVMDWLRAVYSKTSICQEVESQIAQIADFVIFRLKPLLNKQMSRAGHKVLLKTAIMHIMNDLPTIVASSTNTTIISKLAEDLSEGLLTIEEKYAIDFKKLNFTSSIGCCKKYYPQVDAMQKPKKAAFIQKCFENVRIACNNMTTDQPNNHHDEKNIESHQKARNEITDLLVTFTNLSDDEALKFTEIIMKKLRKLTNDINLCASSQTDKINQDIKSANTSVGDMMDPVFYLLTSTPKKKQKKKDISKISKQEIKYMDDLSKLIRAWMTTLPQTFDAPDEKGFKETMVKDLASDMSEAVKVEQLTGPKEERREVLQYVVCRWILRLGAFDIQDVIEQINSLIERVEQIPVPVLTQPQHGSRQALASTKAREGIGAKWGDNYVQKGTDVLEDEISIWMNEQPSCMFADADKTVRQDKIHELAHVLHNNLGKKRSQADIAKDIQQWLNRVVRPEIKNNVGELSERLKDRIINLPQDQTLITENEDRVKYRQEQIKLKAQKANVPKIHIDEVREDRSPEHENTMSMFISNFIEHHYDVDDPLARRAFNRLLNSHLLRLSPLIKKEVYENFENKQPDDRFPPRNMLKELQYIKDISDWLKNLPVDAHYNSLGNKDRTDFVNSLAISIREIEDDKEREPCAMDYDSFMFITILEHLKLLPLPEDYYSNAPFMVDQLYRKIISHRQNVQENIKANDSMNTTGTTGVNPDNIGDFIEEFIRINGADVAQDEIKMEAWAIRLIREIKKIVHNVSAPALSKAQVYDKLADVPVPSHDTAQYFNVELDYIEEITKWMKNLPLLPMNETEKANVTIKICDLAEKVAELDRKLIVNPKQKDAIENELKGYIAKWISELPLDKKHKIVFPVATQQLMNRLAKVKRNSTTDSNISQSKKSIDTSSSKSKKSKSPGSKGKKSKAASSSKLVDTIEKWSRSLPVKSVSVDATKTIKNDISRRLCQSVGQLNMDPTIYNDDTIYKDHLKDDVNAIFETLPQNKELEKKKDKLKEALVDTIIELKNDIRHQTAGEGYKQTLEKTIDNSFPNPIPCTQIYDPGFEIYKDRLATMFILDNFDHSNDAVKAKYEQLLRKEIDRYFDHASNRNAGPLSKDQLYSELYGNLYKVPVPNETSVIDEVEKLKTRCEVDSWFEELPLREPQTLNELLDSDKILATLATRIHEIETSESKVDSKTLKEILKWLPKLPLRSGYEEKFEEFATNLQKRLKSTSNERKCVLENAKKGKKDKSKTKNKYLRPSISGYQSASSPLQHRNPRKNSTNEMYEIIQNWCNQLPISIEEHDNPQAVKDEITTKIMIKISEINRTPEIFDNDAIYYEVIGQEVEKILSSISSECSQCPGKAARIHQLKEALRNLKPLVEEERATVQFRQDLNEIVENVLDKPPHIDCREKVAYLDTVKNDIIDDFIQYKYSNDDDEEKQRQKADMQEKVVTYTTCAVPKDGRKKDVDQKESNNNMLMKTNQLITELTKVAPQNNEIIRDEVEDIRMKNQVADFFDQSHIPGKKDDIIKVSYAKESLAKRLNELELYGHTTDIENKMKREIEKCLNKLGKDKNQAAIDNFIAQLKHNENERRIPQTSKETDPFETALRKYLPNKGPDSLENYCKRVCNEDRRLQYPNSQQMEHAATNYEPDNYLNQNASHMPARCPAMNIPETFVGKDQHKIENKENRIKTCPSITDKSSSSDDEYSSESDEDTICICKPSSKKKRRAYCMVPMRYLCDGFDRYDSYWCRMPMPGYYKSFLPITRL